MITPEILAISAAITMLAAVAAYFVSALKASKKLSQSQEELAAAKASGEQHEARIVELTQSTNSAAEQVRALELKQQKSETEIASLTARKSELERDLLQIKGEAETAMQARHSAEVLSQSVQTELQENKKQQQTLETQLHTSSDTVKQLEAKLESTVQAKHSAEKDCESAQTELKESRVQQQALESRLQLCAEELSAERKQLSNQKQAHAELGKQAKAFEVKADQTQLKHDELKQQYLALQEKHDKLQQQFTSLNAEHTELKTSLDEREGSHAKQLAQFEEQKQRLSKEFENLANKIFEEKGKSFADTSKTNLDNLLKPFREQIDGFQKRVNDVHDESIKGNANLNAEIRKVLDIGLKMSDEASNLTSALKGDSQQRGAWGEAQLKRTLEMSGLIEDAHYETQSSFKDLEGKQKQTDYLVKLPDNKHIIIDSKVSLVDYDRALSADTPEEHNAAMDGHIKSVKKHIDDLAKKDYTNLIGMRSPSFVLMFMPIEPAYIDALKNSKDLFSYGYGKGIVLVSHTTLIPILRTVANLWMMEKSNAEAREISGKAGDIYNQVCIVAERLQKLGGTLGTVSNHYNNTVKALVGTQGLHGKVERFNQLSSKVSKTMPALEPSHIDFETERLVLAAEPINNREEDAADEQNDVLTIEQDKTLIDEKR